MHHRYVVCDKVSYKQGVVEGGGGLNYSRNDIFFVGAKEKGKQLNKAGLRAIIASHGLKLPPLLNQNIGLLSLFERCLFSLSFLIFALAGLI